MDHFTYELGTEKGGMANRQRVAGRRITLQGSLCAVTERRASAAHTQVKQSALEDVTMVTVSMLTS